MGECKTCRWAKWQMTKAGSVNVQRHGTCKYVIAMPLLPMCVTTLKPANPEYWKSAIWVGDGKECPVWEAKE